MRGTCGRIIQQTPVIRSLASCAHSPRTLPRSPPASNDGNAVPRRNLASEHALHIRASRTGPVPTGCNPGPVAVREHVDTVADGCHTDTVQPDTVYPTGVADSADPAVCSCAWAVKAAGRGGKEGQDFGRVPVDVGRL